MDRKEIAATVIREFGICGKAAGELMVAFPQSEDEGLVDIVIEAAMQTARIWRDNPHIDADEVIVTVRLDGPTTAKHTQPTP